MEKKLITVVGFSFLILNAISRKDVRGKYLCFVEDQKID